MTRKLLPLLCLVWPCVAVGDENPWFDEIGGAMGQSFNSKSNINAYHVRLRKDFRKPVYAGEKWRIDGSWEFTLAYWKTDVPEARNYNGGEDTTYLAAISPVFRLSAPGHLWPEARPYLEAGIGVAYFEESQLAAHDYSEGDLGGHFQFEDRVSIGMTLPRYQRLSLAFSLMHYSNANIGDSNDGINLRVLSFCYRY